LYRKSLNYFFPTAVKTNRTDRVLRNKDLVENSDKRTIEAFLKRSVEIENTAKFIEARLRFLIVKNNVEAMIGLADLLYILKVREKYTEIDEITYRFFCRGRNLEEEAANEVYEERISLYERAANKNVLEALLYLGRVYKKQNNYNKAKEYYEKAANLNNAEAAYELACIIDDGCLLYAPTCGPVEFNEEEKQIIDKCVKLYFKAAYLGHTKAMSVISYCYEVGVGVEKDEQRSKQWEEVKKIYTAHFVEDNIHNL
jgi:tetratricopeptide (TPR) repeat protein